MGITDAIPPAARRPATALTCLLVTVMLVYVIWSSSQPGLLPSSRIVAPIQPAVGEEQALRYETDSLPPALAVDPALGLLGSRLVAFLNRPVESHEEAQERMREHCPLELSDKLVNPDQYKGESSFWMHEVDRGMIAQKRAELVMYLAKKVEEGEKLVWQDSLGTGKGIVMTAGNKDTVARCTFLLRHLKRLGSKLPVEIFHYPDEFTNEEQRSEVESLGGRIREIKGVSKSKGAWKNWQIKGLAMVQSSFREVLSLDSDNAPLRDVAHLFDSPTYTEHGRAAFWPDLSKDHPDNAIWRLVGEQCTLDDWTFESGQMVIDKSGNRGLNLAALWLAAAMMDDRDFWFKMCGGDKDTYRWAWRMLDLDFGRSPRWHSSVGFMASDGYCGHSILQYDLDTPPGETRPRPLFVHSNLLKHLNAHGLHRGDLFTHTKRLGLDTYSLNALNYAHQYVRNGRRGMCLDIDWHPLADSRLTAAEKKEFEIETLPLSEIEGGVFDGFEDAFFDEGGKMGGW